MMAMDATCTAGRALAHVGLWPILLQKSFWGDERKILEALMRFTRRDVRDHIVSSKSITDLRSGTEKPRGRREAQRSTFARFLGLFDFRLLQHGVIPGSSQTRA